MQVTVAEAKARLAELLRRVEAGEDVLLTRHGRPVARLVPSTGGRRRLVGALGDRIRIGDDFDAPLPEVEASLAAPLDPDAP